MKEVTATGQSVEEAVESALRELNTTKDRIHVRVIDEGKKGYLDYLVQNRLLYMFK